MDTRKYSKPLSNKWYRLKTNTKRGLIFFGLIIVIIALSTLTLRYPRYPKLPKSSVMKQTRSIPESQYREELIRSHSIKPDSSDYIIIAKSYAEQNNIEQAIEAYKKAEALEPNSVEILYAIARTYCIKKDPRAVDYYVKVINAARKNSQYKQMEQQFNDELTAVKAGDYVLKTVKIYENKSI